MTEHTATNPTTVAGRIEHTNGYTIYPQGLNDLGDVNASSFAVHVSWRGEHQDRRGGGWSVSRGSLDLLVPSASTGEPHWGHPERFRYWQYRFATFEAALTAARTIVDTAKINGRIWTQWQQHHQEQ